jgi:hypothetical protein
MTWAITKIYWWESNRHTSIKTTPLWRSVQKVLFVLSHAGNYVLHLFRCRDKKWTELPVVTCCRCGNVVAFWRQAVCFQHDRLPPHKQCGMFSWIGSCPSDATGCTEEVYLPASLISRSDSFDSSWRVLWTMRFSCNHERRDESNKESGCKDWTFWFAKCLAWSRIFSLSLHGNKWRINWFCIANKNFLSFFLKRRTFNYYLTIKLFPINFCNRIYIYIYMYIYTYTGCPTT